LFFVRKAVSVLKNDSQTTEQQTIQTENVQTEAVQTESSPKEELLLRETLPYYLYKK